jgi:hypothetical protein
MYGKDVQCRFHQFFKRRLLFQLNTVFTDVSASVLYDVLHDPVYRNKWDHYMLEIKEIGHINPNNSINYYACKFSHG